MSEFEKTHKLELLIPPPVIALLCAIAVYASVFLLDLRIEFTYKKSVFVAFFIVGCSLALIAVSQFRYSGTTIHPHNPDATRQFVSHGIYNYTRNPMYLGMLIVLLGWTVYIGNTIAIVFPIIFYWYITRFQILPEERILTAKFGDEVTEYMKRVRRWI